MMNSRLITCISVMPGNGAKYTATLMALELHRRAPKAKIALVDFDLMNPYLYAKQTLNDNIHGIDNLLAKITAEVLTNSMFMENMIKVPGLFDLLKGTKNVGRENLITRMHVTKIVEMLRANYDYIVMVVPPKTDNAATTYGLFYSDDIVMIARPNFPNMLRFEESVQQNKKMRNSVDVPIYLMYNMRGEKDDISSFLKCISENDIQPLGSMVYEPDTTDNQNIGGNLVNELVQKFNKKGDKNGNAAAIKKAVDIIFSSDEEFEIE